MKKYRKFAFTNYKIYDWRFICGSAEFSIYKISNRGTGCLDKARGYLYLVLPLYNLFYGMSNMYEHGRELEGLLLVALPFEGFYSVHK